MATGQPEADRPLSDEALKRLPSRRAFLDPGLLGQRQGSRVRSDFSEFSLEFELPAGDVERGKALFKKHCGHCHSIYPDNRMGQGGGTCLGPTLFNVWGRDSGEMDIQQKQLIGTRATGLIWKDGPLMNYMKNPRQEAQANVQMNFRGIDDFQTRVDIIHFLKTLNADNPEVAHPPERLSSLHNVFPFNVALQWWSGWYRK
eukprot:TRINITY_DN36560_c0_g1_i1.p1 TRINITY_DN36560_c0_g1~~TRINITY_DN36560_c0_g1_i1.p1  ORF type:complete len:201 (-),score=25.28 TRINITY_DN36560_c0_g1_i1:217-819(-)